MKIKRILNPVAQENTYILENESASLVIDPGSNTSSILAKLEAIAKPVAAILLTHTHYDHIMSVEAVRQAYNHPPVYVAEAEKDWLMNPVHNSGPCRIHVRSMIWRMLLWMCILAGFFSLVDFIKDYNISNFQFRVRSQLLDILSVEFPLSLKKKKLFFLVMPFLKKQLGDGTFLQVITTSYFLAFKINFSLFLTTIVFFQGDR